MGEFRFRRFSVINEKSAMKVNTDGVLLGALMSVRQDDRILLDVGTGTGAVALMAAQRYSDIFMDGQEDGGVFFPAGFSITAIDVDIPSAQEAAVNFGRSEWGAVMSAENVSLEDYGRRLSEIPDTGRETGLFPGDCNLRGRMAFDHIFSNPPYFESTLKSPDLRRREARHSESLSYRELLEFSARWLSPAGHCSMILPAEIETGLCRYARMCGLFPFRIVRIRTVPAKPPKRIVAEFSRERVDSVAEEMLTVQDNGKYTEQYVSITAPFYLQVSPGF